MSKGKEKLKRFEFYRIISELNETGLRIEALPIKKCKLSQLAKTCLETYGDGDFVALELPITKDGLPLSYWIIKARGKQNRKAFEQKLSSDEKAALRSVWPIPTNEQLGQTRQRGFINFYGDALRSALRSAKGPEMSAYALQRGVEASAVANYLKNFPEPIRIKIPRKNVGGRPRKPLVDEAERIQNAKVPKKERIEKLIEFQKKPGKTYTDKELHAFETQAYSADETARTRRRKTKDRNS